MRITSRLLVLGAVLILLSGSPITTRESSAINSPEWQTEIERLLTRNEEDLANYKIELQQAGEDIYGEKQGELLRAQAQTLHNEARTLQAQMQLESRHLQEELSSELLRQQLQLILVGLDVEQRDARFKAINQLQDQLKSAQDDLEASYQEQLQQLQAEHEKLAQEEIRSLQVAIERFLEEEFAQYELALTRELEVELTKMASKQSANLRSPLAIR